MSTDHTQSTYNVKTEETQQNWWVIDAKGKVLGRLAQEIAVLLMGKHKPAYTPNVDNGDFVVVLNAGHVDVTGRKRTDKEYQHYTGYSSGLRKETFESLNGRRPGEPLRLAVKRMLPKTSLGKKMLKKLKIFSGSDHPHVAQAPKAYTPTGRAKLPASN